MVIPCTSPRGLKSFVVEVRLPSWEWSFEPRHLIWPESSRMQAASEPPLTSRIPVCPLYSVAGVSTYNGSPPSINIACWLDPNPTMLRLPCRITRVWPAPHHTSATAGIPGTFLVGALYVNAVSLSG